MYRQILLEQMGHEIIITQIRYFPGCSNSIVSKCLPHMNLRRLHHANFTYTRPCMHNRTNSNYTKRKWNSRLLRLRSFVISLELKLLLSSYVHVQKQILHPLYPPLQLWEDTVVTYH